MTATPPAVVKTPGSMSREMEAHALKTAIDALESFNNEKDVATAIKREFDRKYPSTWHCFVGRNFGSHVTHETHNYIYFYIGQTAFLLFKSG